MGKNENVYVYTTYVACRSLDEKMQKIRPVRGYSMDCWTVGQSSRKKA